MDDCCLADIKARNFRKPRYKTELYQRIVNREFDEIIPQKKHSFIFYHAMINLQKIKLKKISYIRSIRISNYIKSRQFSYNYKLKNAFCIWAHIRWVHHERIINNSKFYELYHKTTLYFARNTFETIALLNNSFKFYPGLLVREKELNLRGLPLVNKEIYKTKNTDKPSSF